METGRRMHKTPSWLLAFRHNTYSQTGEDGVIDKILEILPQNDKWCVEFGAWDGKHLSNTRNLIEQKDYSAILIEGDKKKFAVLQKNYSSNLNVITLNEFVGYDRKGNVCNMAVIFQPTGFYSKSQRVFQFLQNVTLKSTTQTILRQSYIREISTIFSGML